MLCSKLSEKHEGFPFQPSISGFKTPEKSSLPAQGARVMLVSAGRCFSLESWAIAGAPWGSRTRGQGSVLFQQHQAERVMVFAEEEFPCSSGLTDTSEVSRWEKTVFSIAKHSALKPSVELTDFNQKRRWMVAGAQICLLKLSLGTSCRIC